MKINWPIAAAILLCWTPVAAPAAWSAFWQWSQVSGNNTNSDPTIDWHIGMAPSAVSGSSRSMMAQLAKYRDDVSGLLTTGGSSTAYTITTNQGLCTSSSTPQDGQTLSITMGATNGASATFQADSCTAYPIQSSAGTAVASGTLISGSPYKLKFSNANSAWMLFDFHGSNLSIPLGALIPFTGQNVPSSNFIFPAGQCLSTTTYAAYWVLVGSPASGACPGGQFAVIDVRGRTTAGIDNLNGTPANRLTSSSTGCGTAMTSIGTVCANGLEGFATTLAQLPTGIVSQSGSQSISVSSPNGSYPWLPIGQGAAGVGNIAVQNGASNSIPWISGGAWSYGSALTGSLTTTVTSTNTGGQAHPSVQPTIGVAYILRVL